MIFRDRAFCLRSDPKYAPGKIAHCANESCDRFVGKKVRELASKAGIPIGWADLHTSKCGFQPLESTDEDR